AARPQDSHWPVEGSYRYRSFASDLCDVGALLIAFVALDFVSGAYRAPLLWVVYGSMFIAASAAAIMRGSILTGLALLISATGAALHVRAVAFWPVMDWAILIAMWILLAVYISSRLGGVSHPYIDALVRTQMWGPEGTWKKSAPGEVAAS
ncbi:MAG TPA: hypothetical protein VHK90_07620, partial [Thermoanaerobaculia bacterium]|nr:hypothetical protein [Thermoanaerobaculia bacterium]